MMYKNYSLKKTTWCEQHGETEALLNGKCRKCYDEEAAKLIKQKENGIVNLKKIDCGFLDKRNIYLNATFDNYRLDASFNRAKQIETVAILKAWDGKQNVVMLGSPGAGKTHLAAALIDRELRKKRECFYIKFYELINICKNDAKQLAKLRIVDLLVVDEYGRSNNDWSADLFFQLIDCRTDLAASTVIISNHDKKKFVDSIDGALFSRLRKNALPILEFNWDDYRLKGDK